MKNWWLLLLLIPIVHASSSISDWPYFFIHDGKFSAKYVVGEEASSMDVVSATVISTSLAKFQNVTTEIGTSTLDTEISDISDYDAIIVGSPCDNTAAFQLMGNPSPCYKDLGGSMGYIKLYENHGKVQLLITGLDEKDRNAAAKFLAKGNLKSIDTSDYLVPSSSGSMPAFFEQKNSTKNDTIENITNTTNELTPLVILENVAEPAPKKIEIGPYEPIEEIPKEEKGWWQRFWEWIMSWFT